ncbi:MAG: hypothetical protein JO122_06195 [Acetobacteraceae bacterium]|nr:hypothetical protein [Acetobacteraceae bacterium]
MIRHGLVAATVTVSLLAPSAFALGNSGTTTNPLLQPNVHRPAGQQRHWNAQAFQGSGAASNGQNGANGSVAGHASTNAFQAAPARHANPTALGGTALGQGKCNSLGCSNSAKNNANRAASSFGEVGNPPKGAGERLSE